MSFFANRIYSKTITSLPTLILFLVVILGLNINIIYKNYDFIINFRYIIVFFWSLKKPEHLGYGLIFFAGIINDVVQMYSSHTELVTGIIIMIVVLGLRKGLVEYLLEKTGILKK